MISKKKNLLFVFADQWRGDAVGFAGADPVLTPNIDEFCAQNIYCKHAFSTFPVCTPHRASLITGKYPLSTGIFTNCKIGLNMRLGDDEIGIGQMLKEHGYQTAYIGKWHLDEPEQNSCKEPPSGARDWDAFTPKGVRRHGFDYWYSYGTYDVHLHPHYWKDTNDMIKVDDWSVKHETDEAIKYMQHKVDKDKPFALYISWNPPHSPYDQVPQKYLDLYPDVKLKDNVCLEEIHHHTGEEVGYTQDELKLATRQYYAAVSGIDEQFGRLIKYLKETGLYDNTVVVLSSDHGDMMGSHGLMGKHVWYDESIRIPFVVHTPDVSSNICNTCIGSQDMLPTVLGLLDLPIPSCVEGVDCSNALKGIGEDLEKEAFLCACPGRNVFLDNFEKAGKSPKNYGWRGIRTQDYTYVIELGYNVIPCPKRYLYDMKNDPHQKQQLLLTNDKNKSIAIELEKRIINWLDEYNDGFKDIWEKEKIDL